jgi:hypothetical protein
MLGCGNSTLSEDVRLNLAHLDLESVSHICLKMWDDGYRNIVNVDVRSHLFFPLDKREHIFDL